MTHNQDQAPDDSGATPEPSPEPKKALSGISRTLDPSDLSHPGVQKMILDRLDSAEANVKSLEAYRENYHQVSKTLAVAQSSLKRVESLDIMQSALIGVGCLILGYLPSVWSNASQTWIVAIAGLALLAFGVISKRKNK